MYNFWIVPGFLMVERQYLLFLSNWLWFTGQFHCSNEVCHYLQPKGDQTKENNAVLAINILAQGVIDLTRWNTLFLKPSMLYRWRSIKK